MLISAGASLLGGLLGRRSERKAIKAQNAYNDPRAVRARAEAAGFNPLLFIGPGVGQQTTTGGTNFMGAGIASAGLAIADGIDRKKMLDIERQKVAQDQRRLDALIEKQTLRPKVGGVYSGSSRSPTLGGVGSSAPSSPMIQPPGMTNFGPRRATAAELLVPREVKPNTTTFISSDGTAVDMPLGPDPEEVAGGLMVEAIASYKNSGFKSGVSGMRSAIPLGPNAMLRSFYGNWFQKSVSNKRAGK
jgi:hypothetical protein